MAAEWRAKHLLGAAVALVIGLAVGGLGPRSEARGLREQLAVARDRECEREVGREIATVFQGRPWEPAPPPDPPPDPLPGPVPEVEPPDPPENVPDESLDTMRDA